MADRHGGPRMAKEWAIIPGGLLDFTADATQIGSSILNLGPATVLRMLGEYAIGPVTAPVTLETAELTVAIGVASSDAVALGASAMPDPADEPNYPWLYWAQHSLFFTTTNLDPAGETASVRHGFDVRSMRKIKPRESLVMVVQMTRVSGTPDLRIVLGSTRVLVAT